MSVSISPDFGRWLRRQSDRSGWIGDLARAARTDARFPWAGTVVDMEDRVRAAIGGNGELVHAFGAALDEWHGRPFPLHLERARRDAERLMRMHDSFKTQMDVEVERQRLERIAREAEQPRSA